MAEKLQKANGFEAWTKIGPHLHFAMLALIKGTDLGGVTETTYLKMAETVKTVKRVVCKQMKEREGSARGRTQSP